MITSCYLIFAASLIDVFDGKIARKLGTSGSFGKQIDSIADLVSFCLFPSFLLFGFFYFNKDNYYIGDWYVYLFTSAPLVFGAIRLARFNAYQEQSKNESYLGLPTPANCLFISSMILSLLLIEDSVENNFFIKWIHGSTLDTIPIFLSVISSLLLITRLKYSKFPILKLNVSVLNTLNILSFIIFITFLIVGYLNNNVIAILNIFVIIYLISGFINSIITITGKNNES